MNQTIPANEPERLVALTNYAILDTLPEAGFDEITELAAQICGCPAALVSFVDASRQWIKAKYGPLPAELSECPREISICTATICNNDILYVPDLIKDQRFNTSPLVTGDMHIRFYCGVPLITQDGYALGTLCVIAFEPRELTFEQQEALRRLARQTMVHLELRRQLLVRNEMLRELERARDHAIAGKAESDKLLLNILPPSIASELKANDRVQPRFFDSATVILIDFTGFTRLVETMEPASVIDQLDQHFTGFDDIMANHRLEKLKTIGDAYLAVGGVPEPNRSHAIDAALACAAGHRSSGQDQSATREAAPAGVAGEDWNQYRTSHRRRRRETQIHLRYLGEYREYNPARRSRRRSGSHQHRRIDLAAHQDALRDRRPRRR